MTFLDILDLHVQRQPDALAYRFLISGDVDGKTEEWTYGELDRRARTLAARLQALGAAGERALLLFPPGLAFVEAFLGCLYAGVVAVPTYPPRSNTDRKLDRIRAIGDSARPRVVLTISSLLPNLESALSQVSPEDNVVWLATDQPLDADASHWVRPPITGDTLAFLQYTSGSTGVPKGVINTHANLLHNEQMIAECFGHQVPLHIVGWLPLFHDMGLIGNVLQTLYLGCSCTLMSPLAFLQRPARWLKAISHYGAHTSGGPNFAYDHCVRRFHPEQCSDLDLSCWRVAYNGSEPIRQDTLARFTEIFEPYGFREQAFYPCYGLAESTLFVTGSNPQRGYSRLTVKTSALEQRVIAPVAEESDASTTLVSSGYDTSHQRIKIVDPATRRACPANTIGEIWIDGPSVAKGYWNQPAETADVFQAGLDGDGDTNFLRTGDLGFIHDGQLYVSGRLKDCIIIRGRNLFPQDIEATVERCHAAVRPTGCAAFAMNVHGEERLAVAAEVTLRERAPELRDVIDALRRSVGEEHGVHTFAVLLLRPRSLPKTSSGKVQRRACREAYDCGALELVACSLTDTTANEHMEMDWNASASGQLVEMNANERHWWLEKLLQREIAKSLNTDSSGIDLDAHPGSFGLDSLQGLELHNRLESALNVALPVSLIWDEPTLSGVVDRLSVHIEMAQADCESAASSLAN